MKNVSEHVSFPELEENILKVWQDQKVFEQTLEQRKKDDKFVFYDGPPFATGLPHYGHLLASTIKDIIPRYWAMKGFHVERRFGWDCHGLPVEFEIERDLNLSGKKSIEEFGIEKFNKSCRDIVLRYTTEWAKTINRLGRWVDIENAYRTMDLNYMESIWWVFGALWEKGMIYKGNKVLPYSTRIGTPLSFFEANLNYKDVQDPAITVAFPVEGDEDTSILAWTTTPWTLTSNLALCVGEEIEYVKVLDNECGKKFIMAAARLGAYYKKEDEYQVLETFTGSQLVGTHYVPMFDYFADRRQKGAFRVISAEFVSTEDGTGIVHMAPAFGEDDFFACQQAGIEIVMPIDDEGCFTEQVADFKGRYIKEADKDIIKDIKSRGRLISHGQIKHSYPFCYRSDTPLIYKAISTWFVNVESIKDRIIENNNQIHWVPGHLQQGRFGRWLENARDWAISRNRFWGTPIPVWEDESGEERICIKSLEELEKLSGQKLTDLHREVLDKVTITSPTTGKTLYRVQEVLDCWFESGSMPYAQNHYPFENKEMFENNFPADFIGEGLDQTRGWFYTLLVISTALFDKPAYKNVVVNGLILAEDGKKMSKRLKNYPDPTEVIDKYGADALRLYMINSPVVRAEELKFNENGVKDLVRRVLLPLWNSYKFFVTYANIDKWEPKGDLTKSDNILDRWIISKLQSLIKTVNAEMNQYHLYSVVPALLGFIDELTDTYIRLNRRRFWEDENPEDKNNAYSTLYYVLFEFTKLLAPFAPFVTDEIHSNLSTLKDDAKTSIHLEQFPEPDETLIDPELEDGVTRLEQILIMGRNIRNQSQVKVKIPLNKLVVIHKSEQIINEIKPLEGYMLSELNVKEVEYCKNEQQYVELFAKPNFRVLGPKFGKDFKKVQKLIEAMSEDQILELESNNGINLDGFELGTEEIQIFRQVKDVQNVQSNRFISICLDCHVSTEQMHEGYSRELVSAIQKMRKEAGFEVSDRIEISYSADETMQKVVDTHTDYIQKEVLCTTLANTTPSGDKVETINVDDNSITIGISRI